MNQIMVSCPNCTQPTEYNPATGLSCNNCFKEFAVDEYIAEIFKNKYDFDSNKIKCVVKDNVKQVGEFFLASQNVLSFLIEYQATLMPVIKFAVTLPNKLSIAIDGDESFPSKCLACGSTLRYENYPFTTPTIGCRHENHTYYYQHPLHWAASVLNNQYPKWHFITDIDTESISITKEEIVPAPETTFFEKIQGVKKTSSTIKTLLPETIGYGTKGESIAFWIPKKLQKEVGNLYETINSLRVANLKAVLVNN